MYFAYKRSSQVYWFLKNEQGEIVSPRFNCFDKLMQHVYGEGTYPTE